VHVGEQGLTESVLAEIDRALSAHELIKVRVGAMDRDARDAALRQICIRLGAQAVQHIGKIFVLYREQDRRDEAP
jgi:RNA-binding protein